MLTVHLQQEFFDESTNKFVKVDRGILELEHSLASMSKWESKWKKPFLSESNNLTDEETMDYLRCMTLNDPPPEAYGYITEAQAEEIVEYIDARKTATWFSDKTKTPKSREITTSELIYFWMDVAQINWEAQYWHLSRLLTLIRVHDLKSQDTKPKKLTSEDIAERRRIMDQRRAESAARMAKRKEG